MTRFSWNTDQIHDDFYLFSSRLATTYMRLTRAYKIYALILMTAVFTLNNTDRILMALLLEPIKRDLGLSDTQLGFITGFAFALFYATAGLPLARLADRGNRANLAAFAIGLWGLIVMGHQLIGNYMQLVIARMAAAVGEAGCKPPTYSMVGDYFPEPAERTRAMAVFWLGSPLAGLIGFMLGWVNEQVGWRATFFITGIPGLLLALLVKATLVEPRRIALVDKTCEQKQPYTRAVLSTLWRQSSSRHLCFGLILLYVVGTGAVPWLGVFLVRTHGLGTAELGLWFGFMGGVSGTAGILFGGYVASRWFPNDEAGQMRLIAVVITLLFPLLTATLFLPDKYPALASMLAFLTVLSFFFAPIYGLLQRLVADNMRATALAIVTLFVHLIGMGLGPQLVGLLSDLLAPRLGVDSLRTAILIVALAAFGSSYFFWQIRRTVGNDLAAVPRVVPVSTVASP